MRASGFQFFLYAALLSACDIHSVAKSDQALGQVLSVGAWLDPALEPLTGCAALNGVWSNHGNKVRDDTVDPSILTAVLGLANETPDAAFADTVALQYSAAEGLAVRVFSAATEVVALTIQGQELACGDSRVAVVNHDKPLRMSVDASGALWVDEHRYPVPGTPGCRKVGFWTNSAPDGMATVIPGGMATLTEPGDPTQQIRVRATLLEAGVRVPATAVYLLPGEHLLPAQVWFQPESRWDFSMPSAAGALTATLESCHVYALMGYGISTAEAMVGIVDLGEDFNWRDCHTRDNPYKRVEFDGKHLTISEMCYRFAAPDWRGINELPPRVIEVPAQLTLYRDADGKLPQDAQP